MTPRRAFATGRPLKRPIGGHASSLCWTAFRKGRLAARCKDGHRIQIHHKSDDLDRPRSSWPKRPVNAFPERSLIRFPPENRLSSRPASASLRCSRRNYMELSGGSPAGNDASAHRYADFFAHLCPVSGRAENPRERDGDREFAAPIVGSNRATARTIARRRGANCAHRNSRPLRRWRPSSCRSSKADERVPGAHRI